MLGPLGSANIGQEVGTILPQLSFEEVFECTKIHSIAGSQRLHAVDRTPAFPFSASHDFKRVWLERQHPRTGEISLAHNGVLFWMNFLNFKDGIGIVETTA